MYSLAQSKVNNKMWGSVNEEDGLKTLNISQCTSLTPSAVQAVCDSSPALHTCSGRHSLIISGCLNLTSVHCACCVRPHRAINAFPHSAHWTGKVLMYKDTSRQCLEWTSEMRKYLPLLNVYVDAVYYM